MVASGLANIFILHLPAVDSHLWGVLIETADEYLLEVFDFTTLIDFL